MRHLGVIHRRHPTQTTSSRQTIMGDRPVGPFGVDPLKCFLLLSVWNSATICVLSAVTSRAFRAHYFYAYPKRHRWAAVPKPLQGHRNVQVRV